MTGRALPHQARPNRRYRRLLPTAVTVAALARRAGRRRDFARAAGAVA